MGKFINSLLFLGAILAIGLVLSGYKENFELMPSKVPSRLLLDGVYPVKPNPGLSDNGNNAQYLLDPNEFAGSYKSVTNNKKEWDTPCDGSSFPPTNPVSCIANIDVVDVTAAAIVFETAGFAAISVLTTLMTFAAFSLIVPLSLYASAIFSDNSFI